ncbi:uncharacterized protein DS421_19g655590 [Arachis hypogaea]|uniref:Uncharacterized protein n=1 Tax=Arachis hypogaea TaxID=3818 RepID=A0A6B9V8T8_ARAHY|nr:uncharacterized protein DS421_19g655580 [Arachis hypogaea]QHN77764.1 uncharacterized protein DS421_19g655590 [Arachis hypogaea]
MAALIAAEAPAAARTRTRSRSEQASLPNLQKQHQFQQGSTVVAADFSAGDAGQNCDGKSSAWWLVFSSGGDSNDPSSSSSCSSLPRVLSPQIHSPPWRTNGGSNETPAVTKARRRRKQQRLPLSLVMAARTPWDCDRHEQLPPSTATAHKRRLWQGGWTAFSLRGSISDDSSAAMTGGDTRRRWRLRQTRSPFSALSVLSVSHFSSVCASMLLSLGEGGFGGCEGYRRLGFLFSQFGNLGI